MEAMRKNILTKGVIGKEKGKNQKYGRLGFGIFEREVDS